MKDHRGKLLRSENNNFIDNAENYFGDNNNNYFPEFPCRKHPASSSSSSNGGICAYCLNDRLSQLVCPDCGEQRISSYGSCSCSRNFSDNNNHNNNNTDDVSGRISVLLENDHHHQKGSDQIYNSRSRMGPRSSNFDEFDNTHFQRSYSVAHTAQSRPSESSSGTGNKFWKIGKLFRKKKDHNKHNQNQINEENNYGFDPNHNNNHSRTSFRGFYDSNEDQNYGIMNNFPVSSSAARASSVSTGNFVLDSAKISCFSESEARFSNFEYCSDTSNFIHPNKINNNNNIFSSRETEFVHSDDQAYIDLKLPDMSSSSSSIPDFNTNPPNLAAMKRNRFGLSTREFGYRGENGFEHQMYNNGGGRSCRISSVGDRDLRKCRKSYKVWKWFSKHHNNQNDSDKFDDHHRDFNL